MTTKFFAIEEMIWVCHYAKTMADLEQMESDTIEMI